MPRKQPETNRKRPGAVWLDAPTAAIERGNDTPSRGREVLPLTTGATCNLWPLPPGTKQRCRPLQGPPSVEHECASHPFRESKSYRRSAQETCNFQAETSIGLTPFGPTAALASSDMIEACAKNTQDKRNQKEKFQYAKKKTDKCFSCFCLCFLSLPDLIPKNRAANFFGFSCLNLLHFFWCPISFPRRAPGKEQTRKTERKQET